MLVYYCNRCVSPVKSFPAMGGYISIWKLNIMPNQRKKGKKQITFFEWEHNMQTLRDIANEQGVTLSELLRQLTEDIATRYGKKYKKHKSEEWRAASDRGIRGRLSEGTWNHNWTGIHYGKTIKGSRNSSDPSGHLLNHYRLSGFFCTKVTDTNTTNMKRYNIIRHYFKKGRRVIERGLTLEQAQSHCSDRETSSSTCTKSYPKSLTRKHGPWFDGYTEA